MERTDTHEWLEFFRPHFSKQEEAMEFVARCEAINRDYRPPEEMADSTPKIMMHQTARLIGLADRLRELDGHHDPLSLLFLIICVECVAKLFAGYKAEGQSKRFVRTFFAEHVDPQDQTFMMANFRWGSTEALSIEEIADVLYALRCDVVHEGRYWRFSFSDDVHRSCLNLGPRSNGGTRAVEVGMTFSDLRDVVVRGCIAATRETLDGVGNLAIQPSESRFWRTVSRLRAEVDWLRTEQTALERLIGVECIGRDFFRVAHTALLGDRLLRLVRVFEQSTQVASFWYLHRCQPQKVGEGLDVQRLKKFAARLKPIRDKTFVHIDKDGVFDPNAVYKEAGITGGEIRWAINSVWDVLERLRGEQPSNDGLYQHFDYVGDDIKELVEQRDRNRD